MLLSDVAMVVSQLKKAAGQGKALCKKLSN